MTKVCASAVIDAPVDVVWAILREFDGMPRWHPAVTASAREGDAGVNAPGAIRALALANGAGLREQLRSLDDEERETVYTLLSGPLPVCDYVGHLTARPVTLDGRTFVEWGAEFAVTSEDVEAVRGMMREVYEMGLKGLAAAVAA